jgi:O-antigen ligase
MLALSLIAAIIMAGFTLPSLLPSNTGSPAPASAPPAQTAEQARLAAAEQARLALAGSTTLRVEAIKAAWQVLLQKPLFGWGLLSAGAVLSAATGHTNYVDDTYVQTLVELGALGFAAFALLIFAALGTAVRLPWSAVHLSRLLALVMLLGMAALASFLNITQGYAAFVIVVALATVGAPAAHPETRSG